MTPTSQASIFSTGDLIAIAGVALAAIALLIAHFYRRDDDRVKLKSALEIHVVPGPDGREWLHGVAVRINCTSKRPAMIRKVYLRLRGVDLVPIFNKGFSGGLGNVDAPDAPLDRKGFDIPFRMIGDDMLNPTDPIGRGKMILERGAEMRFFVPVNLPPVLDGFFYKARPSQVNVTILLGGDDERVLHKGKELLSLMTTLKAKWKDKPLDPRYPQNFHLRTVSKSPPDTARMGTVNDRPIAGP